MKVKRGYVLILDYPYSSGTASSVRLALVVQNDARNQQLTRWDVGNTCFLHDQTG